MNHLTLNVIASCMKEFEKIGFILNNDPARRRDLKAKIVEIVMNADNLASVIPFTQSAKRNKLEQVMKNINGDFINVALEKTDDSHVVREMTAKLNTRLSVVYSLASFEKIFGGENAQMTYTRLLQEVRLLILEKTANLRALKSRGVHLPQEAIKRDIMRIKNIGYYIDHVQFQLLLAEVIKEIYGDDEEECVARFLSEANEKWQI
jgi:enoyl reductase-like protein